jgi:protein gp37
LKTASFYDPIKRDKNKEYKITGGEEVYACLTSDFFIEEADEWRNEAWGMIYERRDLRFNIITKRIARAGECLPDNWGEGYDNVAIGCTVESQAQADIRLPAFKKFPAKNKFIICEPLLERIDISGYIGPWAGSVSAGGESGPYARACDYEWVVDIRNQCVDAKVNFIFRQTGANFIKDGKIYKIPRAKQETQAARANINVIKKH